MDQRQLGDVSVHESPNSNKKLNVYGSEKSSTTPDSKKSPSLIIMAPLALFSGLLGGLFVVWIYTPIVHNGSTEWPDEGGLIAMSFATILTVLFPYLWRVIQR